MASTLRVAAVRGDVMGTSPATWSTPRLAPSSTRARHGGADAGVSIEHFPRCLTGRKKSGATPATKPFCVVGRMVLGAARVCLTRRRTIKDLAAMAQGDA